MQQSEDTNPQLRIVVPPACSGNPLASPLPAADAASSSKMPTSTTKGLASFSLNRSKRGELTALDPQQPSKKMRSPEGGYTAPAGSSSAEGACRSPPSPCTAVIEEYYPLSLPCPGSKGCAHNKRLIALVAPSRRRNLTRRHDKRCRPVDGHRSAPVRAAKRWPCCASGATWWSRSFTVRAVRGSADSAAQRKWL